MNRISFALLALTALAGAARAQNQSFVLEGAVIDSRTGASLGVSTERGEVASLFRAQKALTFGILRSAGVDLNLLPPEVRARIERFQTTNLEAFRAYSNGLDLKDQGRFAEAREQFRRAAEIDPGFGLAVEQQQAMPEVTLSATVQLRAVLATSAGQAVSRGQAVYAVDAQRAIAAAQAGLAVVQLPPTDASALGADDINRYTSNPAGSGGNFLPNLGTATTFALQPGVQLALANEWRGGEYVIDETGQLAALRGSVGPDRVELLRGGATPEAGGSVELGDPATRVYWGRWLSAPGASAVVTVGNSTAVAPTIGAVDWIAGEATRQLPLDPNANFTPVAGVGNLSNVSGSIGVNFAAREATLLNLGFTLDGLVFSGLQGTAQWAADSLSGVMNNGRYTAGQCAGCNQFVLGTSSFGGSFLGANAAGMLFTTTLTTDGGSKGGVTLLRKGP